MIMNNRIPDVYGAESVENWADDNPMYHASGIWGRGKLLRLLEHRFHTGDRIVDLGCGTGYVTSCLTRYVGTSGSVIGYDKSKAFIESASLRYGGLPNVRFRVHDLVGTLPERDGSVDRFVSSMLLQNLYSQTLAVVFGEVSRCLKDDGEATVLTLHPDMFKSPWELDFITHEESFVQSWRESPQDDVLIRGFVTNSRGGRAKEIFMVTHSMEQMTKLLHMYQLTIHEDLPICIDRQTAERWFGLNETRRHPINPVFWIFSVRKIANTMPPFTQ